MEKEALSKPPYRCLEPSLALMAGVEGTVKGSEAWRSAPSTGIAPGGGFAVAMLDGVSV